MKNKQTPTQIIKTKEVGFTYRKELFPQSHLQQTNVLQPSAHRDKNYHTYLAICSLTER